MNDRAARGIADAANDTTDLFIPRADDASVSRFLPVPLRSLRVDTITDFDLYLRIPQTGRLVLYRDANLIFQERHRETLLSNNVRNVYIRAVDRGKFVRYVEGHLSDIIHDADMQPTQRARIVYECGRQLAREVLEKPWMANGIRRAAAMVTHTVDLLLRDPQHLSSMMRLMSLDYELYTHSVNVCVYGLALGQRLGLSEEELEPLGTGLLLHDVGKAGINPKLLHKQGPLTPDEWELMQQHPTEGANILQQTGAVAAPALMVVAQHHEKCSGRGYPRKLRGSQIHQYAKIAALADVFDTLTTHKPDRNALDSFAAIRAMHREMADDFQPIMLRAFVRLMGTGGPRRGLVGAVGGQSNRPRRRST